MVQEDGQFLLRAVFKKGDFNGCSVFFGWGIKRNNSSCLFGGGGVNCGAGNTIFRGFFFFFIH